MENRNWKKVANDPTGAPRVGEWGEKRKKGKNITQSSPRTQRAQRRETQEHSQEWLCHKCKRNPRGQAEACATRRDE